MIRARLISFLAASLLALTPALADAKPKKKKEKTSAPDTTAPVITHVRVTKAPKGKPLILRARFEDDSEIFAPSVYVRSKGAAEFETISMKRVENGYEATIAPERLMKDLEYFIEAFDEEGNGPAREGSPESPLMITIFDGETPIEPVHEDPPPKGDDPPRLEPKPPEEEPRQDLVQVPADPKTSEDDDGIATTWWFWTIIGVAVTGGVAATVIALQSSGGPVDSVDIRVIGPDPAGGL